MSLVLFDNHLCACLCLLICLCSIIWQPFFSADLFRQTHFEKFVALALTVRWLIIFSHKFQLQYSWTNNNSVNVLMLARRHNDLVKTRHLSRHCLESLLNTRFLSLVAVLLCRLLVCVLKCYMMRDGRLCGIIKIYFNNLVSPVFCLTASSCFNICMVSELPQ